MKILYIGHQKDNTGWGDAAINNILALNNAGVDVVPRAISYNHNDDDINPKILELEQQSISGCDVCIQHTLPHNYAYNSSVKNIGFLATESSDFIDTGWHKNINMMDELWVPSLYTKKTCEQSGVKIPVKIVPHSLDINYYIQCPDGTKIQQLLTSFNFAFVGEFIERKNLKALLRAFHTEFHPCENVNLFIKTSGTDLSQVQEYCSAIKKGIKLRNNYKEEIILTGKFPKNDYVSLLKQCHCLVVPSRGEGFCIPALESMSLGIPVIYTKGLALEEFCLGEPVNSYDQPCFGGVDSLPNLYTANSTWKEIDILDLQIKMRGMFLKWKNMEALQKQCQLIAKTYSHEHIGKQIAEILNDG